MFSEIEDMDIEELARTGPLDFIRMRPDIPWDASVISARYDITVRHLRLKTLDWDWSVLAWSPKKFLTFDDLSAHAPLKRIQ